MYKCIQCGCSVKDKLQHIRKCHYYEPLYNSKITICRFVKQGDKVTDEDRKKLFKEIEKMIIGK